MVGLPGNTECLFQIPGCEFRFEPVLVMCMYFFFFPESELIELGASPVSQEEADMAKKLSHVWKRVTITTALPSKSGSECYGKEVRASPLKDRWCNSPWSEWAGRIRGWL